MKTTQQLEAERERTTREQDRERQEGERRAREEQARDEAVRHIRAGGRTTRQTEAEERLRFLDALQRGRWTTSIATWSPGQARIADKAASAAREAVETELVELVLSAEIELKAANLEAEQFARKG